MFSGLTLVTSPTAAPVSVADAKAHSRIDNDADDSLVAGYITSATVDVEDRLNRALMPQTWRLALRNFPGRDPSEQSDLSNYLKWNHIKIPRPPLISVVSFTYTDTQGNIFNMQQGYGNQTGNYLLDTEPEPGRLVLPFSGIWPTTILLPGSPIKITYVCGYPAFSGVVNLGADGSAVWVSGDKFAPSIVGTWITVAGQSYAVASVADDTHLQLVFSASIPPIANASAPYSANAVPVPARNAVLYLAAHRYENREPVVTGRGITSVEIASTVDDLLAPLRIEP